MATTGAVMSVNCPSCGKGLRVPAERAGKMAKCPGCLTTFTVPGVGGAAAQAGVQRMPGGVAVGKKREETGRFTVSPTLIVWGTIALIVGGGIMLFVWGPLKVKGQWEAMQGTARDTCESVVVRGLECYLSAEGSYDASKGRGAPVSYNFGFSPPFTMTMPEKVKFEGISSQGMYSGFYHPRTGEVEAKLEIGGTVLPSGVPVHKGSGTIEVTGRTKDGKVTVEVDGKPAQVVIWKRE